MLCYGRGRTQERVYIRDYTEGVTCVVWWPQDPGPCPQARMEGLCVKLGSDGPELT